jgi:hypothetical protein
VSPELAARLASHNIELTLEGAEFSIFTRENCVAVVRNVAGEVNLGSSGMMTESGLAYLVWREGEPRLVSKGIDLPADAVQVETLRRFSEDLKSVLNWKQ